jgi:hypothetical protein
MRLINKTSTITVALVAALVALAIVAHASAALKFSPSHTAGQRTAQVPAAAGQRGRDGPPGSGLSGGQAGPGSGGMSSGSGSGSGGPGTTDNDCVIAYDAVSQRWSNPVPIDSDCASF